MTCFDPDFLAKIRGAFLSSPVPTLADLKARIEAGDDNPTARRDMFSALIDPLDLDGPSQRTVR